MNKKKKEKEGGVQRNSSLIRGRTSKMAWTYIGSALCVAAVTAFDSLIAGISIGSDALAAIAAAAPLLAIAQILHCLLGFGIDKLMIQAIGRGKRKEHIQFSWSQEKSDEKIKRRRAQGGCQGANRRRRTRPAAKSHGELQASYDPWISEWGNPSRAMPGHPQMNP